MIKSIKILIFKDEFEAKILDEILTDNNIPHLIRSYHDSVYDGLWQNLSGWGHIEAPEEYKDDILKFYNQMSLPENQTEPI